MLIWILSNLMMVVREGIYYLLFVQRLVYSMAQDWIHVCMNRLSLAIAFGSVVSRPLAMKPYPTLSDLSQQPQRMGSSHST